MSFSPNSIIPSNHPELQIARDMANIIDEKESETKVPVEKDVESLETTSVKKGDILSLEHVDPVLNAKMHLVNDTIDEIGFTTYQMKLFCLNGFG